MPTYVYGCSCGTNFDVIKSMAEIDRQEACPGCSRPLDSSARLLTRTHVMGASDWNNQTWNPALGCYTKSNAQARQLAKSRGMEEVGNEPPEKIHAHFDKAREERTQERWKKAADDLGVANNG